MSIDRSGISDGDLRILRKIEQDLYYGNGEPSLTVRIKLMEQAIAQIVEDRERQKRKQDKIELLIWGAIAVGIVNLISIHIH